MLFTGHHARKYKGFERVSISAYDPRGAAIDRAIGELAPTRAMLKMSAADYNIRIAEIIKKADNDGVIRQLLEDAEDRDIVLLCWERDSRDCHRRQVATYIKETYNVEVPEAGTVAPLPEQHLLI